MKSETRSRRGSPERAASGEKNKYLLVDQAPAGTSPTAAKPALGADGSLPSERSSPDRAEREELSRLLLQEAKMNAGEEIAPGMEE